MRIDLITITIPTYHISCAADRHTVSLSHNINPTLLILYHPWQIMIMIYDYDL